MSVRHFEACRASENSGMSRYRTRSFRSIPVLLVVVRIEVELQLDRLTVRVLHPDGEAALFVRQRGVIEPERLFLQRVAVIGQQRCAVVQFERPFPVEEEPADRVPGVLPASFPFQLAPYLRRLVHFQLLRDGHRLHRERVFRLNVQPVITGCDQHEGGHDVAAREHLIDYLFHILCNQSVVIES